MFEPPTEDDGIITHIEVYPHDEVMVALQMMYSPTLTGQPKFQRMFFRKADAENLLDSLATVVSLSAEEARDRIAGSIEEHDPEWEG